MLKRVIGFMVRNGFSYQTMNHVNDIAFIRNGRKFRSLKQVELHMIINYIKRQLTIFDINMTPSDGQERPPRDDGGARILLHLKYHRVYLIYKTPTLIRTSSKIPTEYFIEWSTNYREMVVGLISPKSNFSHKERGIKLTLDPKSHKARLIDTFPNRQRIEKLSRSLSIAGSLFWIAALHSSVKATVSCYSSFVLLDKISFKNFA